MAEKPVIVEHGAALRRFAWLRRAGRVTLSRAALAETGRGGACRIVAGAAIWGPAAAPVARRRLH